MVQRAEVLENNLGEVLRLVLEFMVDLTMMVIVTVTVLSMVWFLISQEMSFHLLKNTLR